MVHDGNTLGKCVVNPFFPMKRKAFTKFLLSFVLSCLVLKGLPSPGFAKSPETSTEILRFVTWKPDNPKVWDEAIRQFEEAYPRIRIDREIGPCLRESKADLKRLPHSV